MPWSIGQGRGFATTGSRLFANRAICREMTVAIRVHSHIGTRIT